jgi:hypothetical protein|eukprot:TRINITY_DN12201_c0_g1_i1.p1 TRINITY_DN12201_c0_g1~~TRINITY_DN12201_c0_g1_i1.p1  ORF type:complete len:148 (-),score=33.62 TRINITY_DN12201_c0_g1_i1:86-505(-)
MWQCKFCNYTSIKNWNVKTHEKRKHSTKIENLNKEVKNNQMNNKEMEVEDLPLLDFKKPAQEATIENPLIFDVLRNEVEKEIKDIRGRAQVKKESALRMKRREKHKIIKDCCRRLTKVIKELEKMEPPRRRRGIDWLSD